MFKIKCVKTSTFTNESSTFCTVSTFIESWHLFGMCIYKVHSVIKNDIESQQNKIGFGKQ